MTTCPSRITYPHLKEHFGDEFHVFYLETVCGAPVESGTVCKLCAIKSTTRVQVSRRFDHGLVTGELSPHSHIFGSEWYCKKVATYGTPSQAVVERAMEAQRRARNGIRSVAAKPKLVVRRKASTPSSSASSSSVIDQLQTSIIKRTPSQESMAESMDDPIEVQSIVRMKLKATIVEGVHVWLDEATGNVYTRVSGEPRGPLLGIWNEGTFTKCPCV